MKKLLSYLITIILSLSLVLVTVGCTEEDPTDEAGVTGFKYELVTEERDDLTKPLLDDQDQPIKDVFGNDLYEQVEYSFYKITGFSVSSDDAEKIADDDYSSVSKYREITIPATYKPDDSSAELAVEEIGMNAFAGNTIFTKVTIGSNITKIGQGAFAGCTNLEEIVIPFVGNKIDAVNEAKLFGYIFGDSATDNSIDVTGKIHQRYDENGNVISSEADVTFKIPAKLKKVTILSADEIKECAFYGMSMLEEVVLPATVTKIENHAFFGCSSILTIDIPSNVTEIGDYAFSGATALYNVEFETANPKLEVIGAHAFDGCTLLTSSYVNGNTKLELPSSVKEIGEYAFQGCTSIEEVDFSNLTNLTTIQKGTFKNCISLKKVNFASNNVTVKQGAFNGCQTLAKSGVLANGVAFTFTNVEFESFDFTI